MTKLDCIIGQYYSWYEKKEDSNPWCIIKYTDKNSGSADTIYGNRLNGNLLRHDIGGLFISGRDIRLSIPEEIRWLDACIKAGKWVEEPSEVIINDYQIY